MFQSINFVYRTTDIIREVVPADTAATGTVDIEEGLENTS